MRFEVLKFVMKLMLCLYQVIAKMNRVNVRRSHLETVYQTTQLVHQCWRTVTDWQDPGSDQALLSSWSHQGG